MAMQCRRCQEMITSGQVAHIVYNIIVCNNCRLPHERGYIENPSKYVPPAPVGDSVFEMTHRRMQILVAADAGDVTKRAQEVTAYFADSGKTFNSKSVVRVLVEAKLVIWEKIPDSRRKGEATWKLRLTPLGKKTLNEALYTMKVR